MELQSDLEKLKSDRENIKKKMQALDSEFRMLAEVGMRIDGVIAYLEQKIKQPGKGPIGDGGSKPL